MAKNISFSINQIHLVQHSTYSKCRYETITENKTNSNKANKNAGSVFPDHSCRVLKEKCAIQHNLQIGNTTNIPSSTAAVYSKTKSG